MSEELLSAVVFCGTFLVMFVVVRSVRKSTAGASLTRPPSLPSYPVIGSALSLPKFNHFHVRFLELLSSVGGIIAFTMGQRYGVILQTKEILHEALVRKSTVFSNRSLSYVRLACNPGACGIMDRQYDSAFKKSHHRSLTILRQFGFGKGIMETRINAEVEELVACVRELSGKSFYPDWPIARSVMNVIGSILFGRRFDRGDVRRDAFLQDVYTFVNTLWKVIPINMVPLLRFLPGFRGRLRRHVATHDRMMQFVRENVRRSLAVADPTQSFAGCYRDQAGDDFDPSELEFIVRDLIVAGTETSVSTIRWALVTLANHRRVHSRVQRELDSVVPPDRLPSLDDRTKLPYLDATILELMRRRTVAPLSVPRETAHDTQVGGYFVPAKTTVFSGLYAAHMNPTVWPDPTAFRPERFLDSDGKVVGRDRIIPFGLGRRSCLGELLARQEMFLFIAGLAQSFDIVPPEGHDSIDVTDVLGITLAPEPFSVRLIPRR